MPSYNRNSRKPIQAVQLALAAALLAGSAAHAANEPRTFELTAFSNGTAGAALASGDYDTAIRNLSTHANALESGTKNTNRCVAYTVTHQIEAARAACDAAVREAQQEISTLPISMFWARSDYRNYLALAYSNRAVLYWMSNDTAAAQSDLKKAAAVAPKATFVARNLTALQSHGTVAQVLVAPKS
jgi:tetratricopeptide (TPR) repeat protein